MSMVKVASRLSSLCFVTFVVGMLLMVVSVEWVTAGLAAAATEPTPTLLEKSDRGTVQLPGGMDPMDVVRTVERNRARLGGRDGVSELGFDALAGDSLLLHVAGESRLVDHPAPADGVGPAFHIGGDPVYGPADNSQELPAIASDGANYLVVWTDTRSGMWDIYGTRVSAGGTVLDTVGIAISTAGNIQQCPAVAFDGTDYLVVWEDDRSGWWGIYGARVSVGGTVLDPGGIAISTAAYQHGAPAIAFDGTNCLVVWSDSRSGTGYDIYCARVSAGGSVLDPAGIAVSTAAGDQREPVVAFDGTNYLVAWHDCRNGSYNPDIYCARVSAGGSVLDPAGIAVSTAVGYQWYPAVAFDGTNYLVAWEDHRSTYWDIYGARVSVGGTVLDTAGIAICTAARDQWGTAIAFDGTNYLVVWQDYRSGSEWDIYGARVSAGGSVLDPAGIAISTAPNGQGEPSVAFDGTNYLVAWDDVRNGAYIDIYGARVSVGGSALDPAGIAISTSANSQMYPAVAFDGTNYLVAWSDYRSGTNYDIYGARVSAGGNVLDPGGIAISTAVRDQSQSAIAFDGTNYLVVWEDARGGSDWDIYGARVSTGGTVLDPGGIAISTAARDQQDPAVVFDGTDYLVAWSDYRSGSGRDIYGARVSVGGSVLDPGGIAISAAANDQTYPAIAFDGTNCLVVWHDMRSDTSWDIYGARVSPAGSVVDPDGIAITNAAGDQSPAVAFDGTNYLVVWEDARGGSDWDIYGARVSPAGSVVDPDGIAICTAVRDQQDPAVVFDGTDYLVAWSDYRSGSDRDIYGARVDPAGTVLDPAGMPISVEAYDQGYPAVARGGSSGILIAYQSFTPPPVYASHRIWGNAWEQTVGVGEKQTPAAYRAYQSYPNPFNPFCRIRYDIATAARVSLRVFDVSGGLVRTLVDAWREPGVFSEVWDGRDDTGKQLPSGVYLLRLEAGDLVTMGKAVLLK
jgi:hypothetical protein